jgi:hypothetical protein
VKFFLFLILLLSNNIFAQFNQDLNSGFVVDTIRLGDYALVPKISARNINNSKIASKINKSILEEYGAENWQDKNAGIWGQASLTLEGFEIIHDILILETYQTSRGSEMNRKYFFSLLSGDEITKAEIRLSSLFKYNEYLNFVEKYWHQGLKEALLESHKCCDTDYYNKIPENYSVWGFNITKTDLTLMDYSWGPYGYCSGACSLHYIKTIPIEEVKPLLNDFGVKLINEGGYKTDSYNFGGYDIETKTQDVINSNKLVRLMPKNIFLFGAIGGKYKFKLSVKIEDINSVQIVTGSYAYYSKENQKIILEGYMENNMLELNEFVKGEINGHFSIDLNKTDNSTWTNKNGSIKYDIEDLNQL